MLVDVECPLSVRDMSLGTWAFNIGGWDNGCRLVFLEGIRVMMSDEYDDVR